MTGPEDPAAAGRDRLRAGHADREQVIEALKDAFVQGQADQGRARRAGGPGARRADPRRAGRAHRRHPGLSGPGRGRPARPPAPAPVRRPLARAAAGSGLCLFIAVAAVRVAFLLDPDGPGPHHSGGPLLLTVAFLAVLTALGIFIHGVGTAVEQRRSRSSARQAHDPNYFSG